MGVGTAEQSKYAITLHINVASFKSVQNNRHGSDEVGVGDCGLLSPYVGIELGGSLQVCENCRHIPYLKPDASVGGSSSRNLRLASDFHSQFGLGVELRRHIRRDFIQEQCSTSRLVI